MKFTVQSVESSGAGNGTTQSDHHYVGHVDGDPVEFIYRDAGNNAEYDQRTGFQWIEGQKHEDAIIARFDECQLPEVGDVIDLDPKVTLTVSSIKESQVMFQTCYRIRGDIDGTPVDFKYLDVGKGDDDEQIEVLAGDAYWEILEEWKSSGNAYTQVPRLKSGMSIDIDASVGLSTMPVPEAELSVRDILEMEVAQKRKKPPGPKH